MAAGDLRSDEPILAVGFRALKDFHAPLLAEGVGGRAVELELRPEGRADANSLVFARAFADPAFRSAVTQVVEPAAGERVAFPAVLGDDVAGDLRGARVPGLRGADASAVGAGDPPRRGFA